MQVVMLVHQKTFRYKQQLLLGITNKNTKLPLNTQEEATETIADHCWSPCRGLDQQLVSHWPNFHHRRP